MRNYLVKISALSCMVALLIMTACSKDSVTPAIAKVSPEKGPSGAVLTVTGAGLSDVRSITFENGDVPATFATTFNTDGAILFRVPTDAIPGEQKIIFKNTSGQEFSVAFNVLGFATITAVTDYNFREGDEITLTGKNLDDVTKVVFSGTTTELEVISKTATTLTVKFPATTLTQSNLTITNAAGDANTTQSFVSIDNAFQIFTDDYDSGYQDASWGPSGISTTQFKNGTASKYMTFNKGNWSQDGFSGSDTPNDSYKFLSFWIKGGTIDYSLYIWSSAQPGTFYTFDDFKKITVPANVWTYFKIPVATLKLWGENGSTSWNQFGWRIQGPDAGDETFYIDDVIFIK